MREVLIFVRSRMFVNLKIECIARRFAQYKKFLKFPRFGVEPSLQVPFVQKCVVTNFVNFNVQLAVNQAVEVTNHPKSISEISHFAFVRALFFGWQQINTQITRRQIEVPGRRGALPLLFAGKY